MRKPRPASSLPVYERAVARFPHLASLADSRAFCRQLLLLEAVPGILPVEYWRIARMTETGKWPA